MKLAAPPTGADRTELVYDGNGARIQKKIGQVGSQTTTTYFNDTRGLTTVLQEQKAADPSNPISYVSGLGQFDPAKVASAQWAYFHADAISSRALTDGAGTVSKRWDYDPFGVARAAANDPAAASSDFQFAGEQKDATTGLINLRARSYDPALGRFLSRDVLAGTPGFPQSYNRYTYALNNPLRVIDPSGHKAIPPGQCTSDTPGCGLAYQLYHSDAPEGWENEWQTIVDDNESQGLLDDNTAATTSARGRLIALLKLVYGITLLDTQANPGFFTFATDQYDRTIRFQDFSIREINMIKGVLGEMATKVGGVNVLRYIIGTHPNHSSGTTYFARANDTDDFGGEHAQTAYRANGAYLKQGESAEYFDTVTVFKPGAFHWTSGLNKERDTNILRYLLGHELGHVVDARSGEAHRRAITPHSSTERPILHNAMDRGDAFADAFSMYFFPDAPEAYFQQLPSSAFMPDLHRGYVQNNIVDPARNTLGLP